MSRSRAISSASACALGEPSVDLGHHGLGRLAIRDGRLAALALAQQVLGARRGLGGAAGGHGRPGEPLDAPLLRALEPVERRGEVGRLAVEHGVERVRRRVDRAEPERHDGAVGHRPLEHALVGACEPLHLVEVLEPLAERLRAEPRGRDLAHEHGRAGALVDTHGPAVDTGRLRCAGRACEGAVDPEDLCVTHLARPLATRARRAT